MAGLVADIASELVGGIRDLTPRINQLGREIFPRTVQLDPSLLLLQGCEAFIAANGVGQVAGVLRFKSRAALVIHNGNAPIPVWSGCATVSGSTAAAIASSTSPFIASPLTQMRLQGLGIDYVAKRVGQGNTKTEAIRALRRRIFDEVHHRLWQDEHLQPACLWQAA